MTQFNKYIEKRTGSSKAHTSSFTYCELLGQGSLQSTTLRLAWSSGQDTIWKTIKIKIKRLTKSIQWQLSPRGRNRLFELLFLGCKLHGDRIPLIVHVLTVCKNCSATENNCRISMGTSFELMRLCRNIFFSVPINDNLTCFVLGNLGGWIQSLITCAWQLLPSCFHSVFSSLPPFHSPPPLLHPTPTFRWLYYPLDSLLHALNKLYSLLQNKTKKEKMMHLTGSQTIHYRMSMYFI